MTIEASRTSERNSEILKIRLPPALLDRARKLSAQSGASVSTIARAALVRVMSDELAVFTDRANKRAAAAAAILKLSRTSV